jgi:predicted esterase
MSLSRVIAACALVACSSGSDDPGDPGPRRDAGRTSFGDGGSSADDAGWNRDAAPIGVVGTCAEEPPPGAELPRPLARYSGGVCPALVPGRNTIESGGMTREFLLVAPTDLDPSERLPVLVMWHWLGAEADSLLGQGQVQDSADALRFIALIPEKTGDLEISIAGYSFDPVWPYLTLASDERVEIEAVFFDDMLACAAEQFNVNENCVSTAGVSAGALWVSQLMQVRSEVLASAIVISGGVGPATSTGFVDARGWNGAPHAMPVMVLWGGAMDLCGLNFDRASGNLEDGLASNGNLVLECRHNCGHSAPPVDPAAGIRVLWQFALDHPYWLADGESPWQVSGPPAGTPDWCSIGIGTATARAGSCGEDAVSNSGCPPIAL